MTDLTAACDAIRAAAMSYPETYEESPWGHIVGKVNKKVFLFVGTPGERLTFSFKLPATAGDALENEWASPMGYGMGKHGWVSVGFDAGDDVPVETLKLWVDESYRAVAPRRFVKRIGEPKPEPAPPPRAAVDGLVALLGDDPLRLKRATDDLEARGLETETGDLESAAETILDTQADAVVVDLSRNASTWIAALDDLLIASAAAPLAIVGIRDARMERAVRAAAPGAALFSREPPGDPVAVSAIVAALEAAAG